MVFSSHIFLFYFLPLFLLSYYGLYRARVSISWLNFFVTIASYFFYGWFEPWFVILMWVSTLVDYVCGRAIASPGASRLRRNAFLTASMVVNLGLLGFFKYYMFFMDGINRLAGFFSGSPHAFHVYTIILPIGISFYTFQTMSYTIDVWRGDAKPALDMRTFSCFVASFPQLIAGPIIRYQTLAEQLVFRTHTMEKFARGIAIFSLGFGKKILLANPAGDIADNVFRSAAPDVLSAWWGALAYSFQIYFDFCAYSDMAVGLGLMMGFEFIKNFNAPYRAGSITDFWRRWHMSLTTWFRDYLYISLGGNRTKSRGRLYLNLFIVMFLSGLWHGAKMTFVAWGLFHAAFLILERLKGKKSFYEKLPLFFKVLLTNVIVIFGWVIFRAPTMGQAWDYWKTMIGLGSTSPAAALLFPVIFSPYSIFIMGVCVFLCAQTLQAHDWSEKPTAPRLWLSLGVLVIAVTTMFTQAFNPFLYFQF